MENYRFELTDKEYCQISFALDSYIISKRHILREHGDILTVENKRFLEKEIDDAGNVLSKLLEQKVWNDTIRQRVKLELNKPLY